MLGLKVLISKADNGFNIKFFGKNLKRMVIANNFPEAINAIQQQANDTFFGPKESK